MRELALGAWLLALGLAGCSRAAALGQMFETPEVAAAAMLVSLERRDVAALEGMALSEREFRDHVWPELPAARPDRNLPFSYVWGDLRNKSEHSLQRSLAQHGGQRYTLASVRFEGGTTQYDTYLIHRDTVLRVRDANGAEVDLRLFGSMIEKGGMWKVFSYVTD